MYNFVACKVCYYVLLVTFPMPHDRGCEIKIIVIVIVTIHSYGFEQKKRRQNEEFMDPWN